MRDFLIVVAALAIIGCATADDYKGRTAYLKWFKCSGIEAGFMCDEV